eukprot:scaffold26736_cov151-Skeletonema_menzelii.AAC.7
MGGKHVKIWKDENAPRKLCLQRNRVLPLWLSCLKSSHFEANCLLIGAKALTDKVARGRQHRKH